MISILDKEKITKKIVIAFLFIFLFNFIFANLGNSIVFADEEKSIGAEVDDEEIMESEGGGNLLLPIHALVLFLADAVLELMQNTFISSQPVTVVATSEDMKKVNGWAIFGIVVGVIVVAAATVVTCGAAAAGATAIGGGIAAIGSEVAVATAIGTTFTVVSSALATYGGIFVGGILVATAGVAGIAYSTNKFIDDIKGEFDLPTIIYTPYTIFSGQIPLFDINFFNPMETIDEYGNSEETLVSINGTEDVETLTIGCLTKVLEDTLNKAEFTDVLNQVTHYENLIKQRMPHDVRRSFFRNLWN